MAIRIVGEVEKLAVVPAIECGIMIQAAIKENRAETILAIGNIIELAIVSTGIKDKPNPVTQFKIAQMLLAHEDLTIEEIAIMFREGVRGRLGINFNKFDEDTVSTWIVNYKTGSERCEYFENRHKKKYEPLPSELVKIWIETRKNLENDIDVTGRKNKDYQEFKKDNFHDSTGTIKLPDE